MGLHVAQLTSPADMRRCFELVTTAPARIMGLRGYGLEKGAIASLIVLQASDPVEAIRLKATRLAVISKGKLIATTAPATTEINLPGRPKRVDRRHKLSIRGMHGAQA
jgi:cytosine deaminase